MKILLEVILSMLYIFGSDLKKKKNGVLYSWRTECWGIYWNWYGHRLWRKYIVSQLDVKMFKFHNKIWHTFILLSQEQEVCTGWSCYSSLSFSHLLCVGFTFQKYLVIFLLRMSCFIFLRLFLETSLVTFLFPMKFHPQDWFDSLLGHYRST